MQDLPPEVQEALAEQEGIRQEKLDAFANAIRKMRDEAVQGRKNSGIEDTWRECEEAYLGIDDENRGEFQGARWAKPVSMDGPLVRRGNSSDVVRATAYVRLTARYVDAGAAKLGEIALPVDAKAFSLKPTPVPTLLDAKEDASPVLVNGQPAMRPAAPEEAQAGQPEQVPLRVKELAEHMVSEAEKKAKKSETRIYDWMVEYNHAREMRKVIFDGGRIGVGVIKGPLVEQRTAMKYTAGALTIEKTLKPAARWRDPWNIFPDPGCGENIHDGEYLFERDSLLPSKLKALEKEDGYIKSAIADVLDEGPEGGGDDGDQEKTRGGDKRRFKLWHFYGRIKRADLELTNPAAAQALETRHEYVYAIVTMVNDTVIRAIVNPLDSGRFPFHVFNWRRRANYWAGVGIAEQVRTPQRAITAAFRKLLDNAGKSACVNVVMDPDSLEPAAGGNVAKNWQIGGQDTLWWRIKGATGPQDIRQLFDTFIVPNMTDQLLKVMESAYKMAEEQSSIPLVTQGQSGDTTPDTFSGQQLQDNNANQLLRDVGFGLHDDVTDPLCGQFYEYLLLDPDVPEEEKGDMQVDISGAIALIEKAMQRQVVTQMGALLGRPGSRLDPAKWEENFLRMNRMVPSDFQYSDEDWERIKSQPPPEAPQVQAAKIRAQAQVDTAKSRDELTSHKIDVDTDRDRVYNESMAARDRATTELRLEELRLRVKLAELDYANQERITLAESKVKLADTTMKLKTQEKLAGLDGTGPQVATPPTEPPGQAPDGQAYQA